MKRFSLPRHERLTLPQDFEMVCRGGSRRGNRYLSLYSLDSARPYPRIGLSVSKKIGEANLRNRVKRILREVYRLNRPRLKGGVDIVVVAKKGTGKMHFRSLEDCLLGLFKEMNLLVGEKPYVEKDSALSD